MAAHARFASRVQIASSFFPRSPSSSSGRRGGGHAAGAPPALTADVRVVIRRHFPVAGPGGTRVAVAVAEDIALRRRASRQLRTPELVERALAKDVLPRVGGPFDRAAVVVAGEEICAHVSAACSSSLIALGGVRVLVLIDTFLYPVPVAASRAPPPLPCNYCSKPMWSSTAVNKDVVARTTTGGRRMDLESELPPPKKLPRQPVGVIGDRRVKKVEEPCVDRRFEGWLPW